MAGRLGEEIRVKPQVFALAPVVLTVTTDAAIVAVERIGPGDGQGEPTMLKLLTMGASSLIGIALLGAQPPDDERGGPPPPPPPKKKKAADRPGEDLRKAYQLLRRLRADGRASGRPEERLKDWTERAAKLYRDGVKAHQDGSERLAHEYGAAAHDLARAVEHSRNASAYEERDSDLPPPPDGGPGGDEGRVRADLWRAHDRIQDSLEERHGPADKFYLNAARDLYNAARRDAEAGRSERAEELARAADAITHVSEHLAHALNDGPPPPLDRDDRPEAKGEGPERKRPPRDGDRPKAIRKDFETKRPPRDGDSPKQERRADLPPPL
jgi:hypothetical protein